MDLSDIFRSDKIHAAFSLKTLFNSGNERKLLSSLINLDPKKIVTPEQIHSSEAVSYTHLTLPTIYSV